MDGFTFGKRNYFYHSYLSYSLIRLLTLEINQLDNFLPYNEEELISNLANGDEQAFARLYDHYQPRLQLFVLPLTGFSRQDAEEIIQDIFLKIWLRRETLLTVRSLQAYLFTMARNRLSDLKTQKKQVALEQSHSTVHTEVEEIIQLNEYHAIARIAIDRLPPQKRRIFTLRNEEGLSLDEIAATLNITKFAVKKQLYDAIHSIKEYLKENAGLDIPVLVLICIYL